MLFKKLILDNFGPFHGIHELNLEIKKDDKPIILIGALNGSGKTTIHEALQIVLFGKLSAPAIRHKLGYENLLTSLINSNVDKEKGSSIELSLSIVEDGQLFEYTLARRWFYLENKFRETFSVSIDGEKDNTSSELWSERIQDIFPPRIASLYFFDGEQIEELADIDKLSKTLEEAIYSLLGLDLVQQLVIDLEVIKRNKIKELKKDNPTKLIALESFEKELRILTNEKNNTEEQLEEQKRSRNLRETSIFEKNAEFKKIGGEVFSKNVELIAEKKNLEHGLSKVLANQRELCEGSLPFKLLEENLLARLKKELQKINSKQEAISANSEFEKRDILLLSKLKKEINDQSYLKKMEEIFTGDLENRRAEIEKLDVKHIGNANDIDYLIEVENSIKINAQKATENEQLISEIEAKILSVNRKLAALPSEDKIAKVKGELESLQSDQLRLDTDIRLREENLETIDRKIASLKNELAKCVEEIFATELDNEELKRLNKTVGWLNVDLNQFKTKVVKHHVSNIEQLALEAVNKLIRKDRFITSIKIHPSDFIVSIFTGEGVSLDIKSLSAGERQLISTSILWALSKASGTEYPTVIDTPLGRLDSLHRTTLCKEYFPNASQQVILLSTDEEIKETYYDLVSDRLANEMTLNYDENLNSTKILPGYFPKTGATHVN